MSQRSLQLLPHLLSPAAGRPAAHARTSQSRSLACMVLYIVHGRIDQVAHRLSWAWRSSCRRCRGAGRSCAAPRPPPATRGPASRWPCRSTASSPWARAPSCVLPPPTRESKRERTRRREDTAGRVERTRLLCWGSRCQVVLVPVLALWVCGWMQPSIGLSRSLLQERNQSLSKMVVLGQTGVKAETERHRGKDVWTDRSCSAVFPSRN